MSIELVKYCLDKGIKWPRRKDRIKLFVAKSYDPYLILPPRMVLFGAWLDDDGPEVQEVSPDQYRFLANGEWRWV